MSTPVATPTAPTPTAPTPTAPTRAEWLLLALLLMAAAAIRTWKLDATLFWVDEAESTINALTILEHGVPVDRYLDQPIYENTLVEPWPESVEYEFRDSSYSKPSDSRQGLATYHGWLPLYAMAGSLRLLGIEPDTADGSLRPKHDDWWMRRITVAARLPSILFGVLFLAVLFFAGREITGRAAAWAATAVAACADVVITYSRDARYYSLTLLLATAACWLTWRVARRGRWRDAAAAALVLALLFHTHVVTCVIACAMVVLTLPWSLSHPRGFAKIAAIGGFVAAAALPWAWWSGFLEQAGAIPKAWPLLDLPRDLFEFPLERAGAVGLLLTGIAGAAVCALLRGRTPRRVAAAFGPQLAATWFLATWLVIGWIGFVLLMPAVSNVFTRMALPILGPGLLLAGATAGAVAHLVRGRASGWIAAIVLLAFVFLATDTRPVQSPRDEGLTQNIRSCVAWLRRQELAADTRLYATPNQHLTLSLYTGVPVQSVAPVRKEFLDAWPGAIVLFEACGPYSPPSDESIESAAGRPLAPALLGQLRMELTREAARRRLAGMAAEVIDTAESSGRLAEFEALVARIPEWSRQSIRRRRPTDWCPAVFRNFTLDDWTDWWRIYFFRFVDPAARTGERANYADRLRSARAEMLPYGWTAFTAPSCVR